jgi:hypothetical protein
VAGQAYGTAGNNPGQLLNFGDYAKDANYLYVCAPFNPTTYFGSVKVFGVQGMFSSFYQGLHNVKFIGIQVEVGSLITMVNTSTVAVTGLEIYNCVFNWSQIGYFNNQNSNASPQMCAYSVHDNLINDCPASAIQNATAGGTAGNTMSYNVYNNALYSGNTSCSYGGALFYNQGLGGTNHHVWGNYGFDCRNGTGGNNIDGAMIYADIGTGDCAIMGNVAEQCGQPFQQNCAIGTYCVANLAIDCVGMNKITNATPYVASTSAVDAQNTWIWTGRVPVSSIYVTGNGKGPLPAGAIQVGPGTGAYGPIFAQWNDGAGTYPVASYAQVNNLAVDVLGAFGASKPMSSFVPTHVTTNLVAGLACAGLGNANLALNNGSDVTQTAGIMSAVGSVADVPLWLESAGSGSAKLAIGSVLSAIGEPLSLQYLDIKRATFNQVPSPGCYEQIALRAY